MNGSNKTLFKNNLTKIKMKYASEDEKKRYELIEQKRLEALEEMRRKKEMMDQIKAASENDRIEKSKEKAKSSVANELNFGANVIKFQAPPASR